MRLNQIQCFDIQTPKRILYPTSNRRFRIAIWIHVASSHFRRHERSIAINRLQEPANNAFAAAFSINISRIEKRHTCVVRSAQYTQGGFIIHVSPIAAKLPTAQTNFRNTRPTFGKRSIIHMF